jgi:hypothetical protein
MSSPWFLYLIEEGQGTTTGAPIALTAHELAARLSFHFWQTIPDDELRAAADSGALLGDAEYQKQLARLASDPRATKALAEFFGDWLEPTYLGALDVNKGNPAFDAFRGSFDPTPALRGHMTDEMNRMARYYAFDTDATFTDFFRSKRSFAENDDVATLYGVATWKGGDPPAFSEPSREGLLARAALTSTGQVTTRPIIKGVFARKAILCDTIGQPPPDAMKVAMSLPDVGITSRAMAEAISEARADCAGCHKTIINPLGFPTESFDGLGRFRTTEAVYDPSGKLLANAPVDTSSTPNVKNDGSPEDKSRTVKNVSELNQALLDSEKPQACFARRYFRFTFGREEDPNHKDDCVLAAMHDALLHGKTMKSVLADVASRPEFKMRTVQ